MYTWQLYSAQVVGRLSPHGKQPWYQCQGVENFTNHFLQRAYPSQVPWKIPKGSSNLAICLSHVNNTYRGTSTISTLHHQNTLIVNMHWDAELPRFYANLNQSKFGTQRERVIFRRGVRYPSSVRFSDRSVIPYAINYSMIGQTQIRALAMLRVTCVATQNCRPTCAGGYLLTIQLQFSIYRMSTLEVYKNKSLYFCT
jgi:hypothetical protein